MSHDNNRGQNVLSLSKGFTLVELMLAMTFVAALLVAIALTVIQISNIYNKGITMKEVDQVGRSISDDIKRSISQSQSFEVPSEIYVEKDWGGRLCTGKFSYIWNYGTQMNHANVYKYDEAGEVIRFAKIPDTTGEYCQSNEGAYKVVPAVGSTEMLDAGDRNLVLHTFNVTSEASDSKTKQRLYFIEFSLGTKDQVNINSGNANCKVPNSVESSKRDFAYCAVNLFNLVARSGNVY